MRFGGVRVASDERDDAAASGDTRRDRAGRILDAASALTLRWGYQKTTIDDIARAAGVAKGTIYLHWKSRDALFLALLRRERALAATEIRDLAAQDPAGHTLRGVLAHSYRVIARRPLLLAVLTRDRDVLGRLLTTGAPTARPPLSVGFPRYLEHLRAGGWVRTDQTLAAQLSLGTATIYGFLLTRPLMPDEFAITGDDAAELVADTVCRALDRGSPLGVTETEGVAAASAAYLAEAARFTTERYENEVA
ncbi:TetR/AcrR family transcriptional regulator [Actinoalloteichus caeruleus]|uniref:TetR/AcrR family transcriptional regulator n=1 Tax=Actinoalloteichus cyanogriseus TaxID=2893586 RepID=UPI000690FB68|nr:TetR family transcriptional regulator [Actinoalloteichus caeruleus]